MQVKFKLAHKGIALVAGILVFELFFVGGLGALLQNAERQIDKERRAREAIAHLDRLSILTQNISIGLLTQLEVKDRSDSPRLYSTYRQHIDKIPSEVAALKKLVQDQPEQLQAVERLSQTIDFAIDLMERYRKATDPASAAKYRNELAKLAQAIAYQSDEVLNSHRKIAGEELQKQEASREMLYGALGCGFVANILLGFMAARFFLRNITTRLNTLYENSLRLASGLPLHPVLRGADEIASVDETFHQMAQGLADATRKQRAMVDNAMDMICSLDENERFLAVNPACLQVLGYQPDEMMGRRLMDLLSEDEKEDVFQSIQDMKSSEVSRAIEMQLHRKDGMLIDSAWSISWSPNEKSFFCVARDITERRALERLKQEFVAMVSHDLRTPLTAIQGTLHLLKEKVFDPNTDFGMERIVDAQRSADRLITLVNDLLDLEKLESGSFVADIAPVPMAEMIEGAVASILSFAETREIKIDVQAADVIVLADADRIVQVLVNLLSNAVKYSPRGETVRIECGAIENGADKVCELKVIDRGRGIPEEMQKVIFERFAQVRPSDGARFQGTGLGLAIVKEIVERHDGAVGVVSEEGKGSTFWLRLPLSETARAAYPADASDSAATQDSVSLP